MGLLAMVYRQQRVQDAGKSLERVSTDTRRGGVVMTLPRYQRRFMTVHRHPRQQRDHPKRLQWANTRDMAVCRPLTTHSTIKSTIT